MSNIPIRDPKLRGIEKGVLVYLLSCPDDWKLSVTDICKHFSDGRDAVYAALRKLRSLGYIELERVREDGKFSQPTWRVFEKPNRSPETVCGKTVCGKTVCGKPRRLLTTDKNKQLKTHSTAASGSGGSVSFGIDGESKEAIFVNRFAQFTIERRLHLGRTGSTAAGWSKHTMAQWAKACRELLTQVERPHLKKVMKWYFAHFQDRYTPRCFTFKKFCQRFAEVDDAMKRVEPPEEEEERAQVQYEEQ